MRKEASRMVHIAIDCENELMDGTSNRSRLRNRTSNSAQHAATAQKRALLLTKTVVRLKPKYSLSNLLWLSGWSARDGTCPCRDLRQNATSTPHVDRRVVSFLAQQNFRCAIPQRYHLFQPKKEQRKFLRR